MEGSGRRFWHWNKTWRSCLGWHKLHSDHTSSCELVNLWPLSSQNRYWNNKLLESKWNLNTAMRFGNRANDLALCAVYWHSSWFEQIMKGFQYTHTHSQKGFYGNKWWHAADRFSEVYRHVWSIVSAVGECLPSLHPSILEHTLLPSCLHVILWPELAVRAHHSTYHSCVLQGLIK